MGGMAVAGGHCMPEGAKCFPKPVDNAGSVRFDHEMRGPWKRRETYEGIVGGIRLLSQTRQLALVGTHVKMNRFST